MTMSADQLNEIVEGSPGQDRSIVLHFVYKQGIHAAEIENLKASRDKQGERIGELTTAITRIESEQKHAAETRRMQHEESMAQMGELSARMDKLGALPGQMALFLERQTQLVERADKVEEAEQSRSARSFSVSLPEPTAKSVLALIVLIAALLAAVRAGWPEIFSGANP